MYGKFLNSSASSLVAGSVLTPKFIQNHALNNTYSSNNSFLNIVNTLQSLASPTPISRNRAQVEQPKGDPLINI